MKTKRLLLFAILLTFWTPEGKSQPAGPPPSASPSPPTNAVLLTPERLSEFAEEMRTNHPALRAVEARREAAVHATNAVRTWEDPQFKFGGFAASSEGVSLSEEGDLLYGLEQKLPLFGKARAARTAAATETAVEEARLVFQFQQLRRDLAKALYRKALADRVIELMAEDLVWVEAMVNTAVERYQAGTGTQFDVLRLQNEQARRGQQLRTEQLRKEHDEVALNRFLHRELRLSWPRLLLPPPAGALVYTSKLEEYAVRHEPKINLMEREIHQAEAAVAAARKARWPDVSTSIEGRQYSGDGGFREGAFTLTLTLPWVNRRGYSSDVARQQARLRATEFDASDYRLGVREEFHQVTVRIDAARREALLYADDIVPRSRLALENTHVNWQAGRGLLSDVLEARRMLVEGELANARAVTEQYQALAELVLCCGLGDLEALQNLGILGTEPKNP
jgi:outer membrane protein TolC